MTCTAAAYESRPAAREVAKSLFRKRHLTIGIRLCEDCDRYHLVGDASRLRVSRRCMSVVRHIAMGYTQEEISRITNIPLRSVSWYIMELKHAFYAMSPAHLVAIFIALGILDPREFVPPISERTHNHAVRADDRNRETVQRDRAARVLPGNGKSGGRVFQAGL